MELNLEGFEIQNLNIPTDEAQKVKAKNGSFVFLSCFLPELRSVYYQSFC